MISNENLKGILFAFFVIVVMVIGTLLINEKEEKYRESVVGDAYFFQKARFEEVGKAGMSGPYYVSYEYEVKSKKYSRSVSSKRAFRHYDRCILNSGDCSDVKSG